jgi:hypothetical protein
MRSSGRSVRTSPFIWTPSCGRWRSCSVDAIWECAQYGRSCVLRKRLRSSSLHRAPYGSFSASNSRVWLKAGGEYPFTADLRQMELEIAASHLRYSILCTVFGKSSVVRSWFLAIAASGSTRLVAMIFANKHCPNRCSITSPQHYLTDQILFLCSRQ